MKIGKNPVLLRLLLLLLLMLMLIMKSEGVLLQKISFINALLPLSAIARLLHCNLQPTQKVQLDIMEVNVQRRWMDGGYYG